MSITILTTIIMIALLARFLMLRAEQVSPENLRELVSRDLSRFDLRVVELGVESGAMFKPMITGRHDPNASEVTFSLTVGHAATSQIFKGTGRMYGQSSQLRPIYSWHGPDPTQRATRELPAEAKAPAPPEDPAAARRQRVVAEVNRRLDQLTGNPAAMMRYDLDGNGMIDSEEWDRVRAQLRAEVEHDLGDEPEAPTPPEEPPGPAW